MALDDQLSEVAQGETAPRRCKLFCVHQPSQNLRDLDINEIRRMDTLLRIEHAGSDPLGPRRLQHQLYGR